MINPGIFHISVSKFSFKKESGLIVLFIINKSSKIGLYHIVLLFCLAISLRMESSRESSLNFKKIA